MFWCVFSLCVIKCCLYRLFFQKVEDEEEVLVKKNIAGAKCKVVSARFETTMLKLVQMYCIEGTTVKFTNGRM